MTHFPASWFGEKPLVLGHRGASYVAPENTMAAFSAAMEAGADGVELDVHLTSDGIPVVIHNARVDRTTDGQGLVNDLTLAEVLRLNVQVRFDGWTTSTSERIPTLEEVLIMYGYQLLVNIELKSQFRPEARSRLEATVAALVHRLKIEERVWVSSFKPYSLFRMRQVAPELPCGLLYSPLSMGTAWLAPLTPFEAFHPQTSLVSRWFVWLAHQVGKRVVVWTVDDVSKASLLEHMGVDAIITNDPQRLVASRMPG